MAFTREWACTTRSFRVWKVTFACFPLIVYRTLTWECFSFFCTNTSVFTWKRLARSLKIESRLANISGQCYFLFPCAIFFYVVFDSRFYSDKIIKLFSLILCDFYGSICMLRTRDVPLYRSLYSILQSPEFNPLTVHGNSKNTEFTVSLANWFDWLNVMYWLYA
jgi:hypothetical protein